MRNCAASAPQATRNAAARMLGNVHSADSAEPPAVDRKAVALVSRAPKIVRPRRPNKHGTR